MSLAMPTPYKHEKTGVYWCRQRPPVRSGFSLPFCHGIGKTASEGLEEEPIVAIAPLRGDLR